MFSGAKRQKENTVSCLLRRERNSNALLGMGELEPHKKRDFQQEPQHSTRASHPPQEGQGHPMNSQLHGAQEGAQMLAFQAPMFVAQLAGWVHL